MHLTSALLHRLLDLRIFVVIHLVSHSQPLGLQLFAALTVHPDTHGIGWGRGIVPKNLPHVVMQSQHRGGGRVRDTVRCV